jgi:muramoyltetrapeptide carboxypeptidase
MHHLICSVKVSVLDFPVGHVSMNVPLINGAAVTLKVGKKEVKLSFNTERE